MAEAAAVSKKKGLGSGMQILIAMVAAILAGIFFGAAMKQIEFIDSIFFRLIQMGIFPFVMCTIITSVGSLTPQQLSGNGLKGILVFVVTSGIAAAVGIFVSLVMQPGAGLENSKLVQEAVFEAEASTVTLQDTLLSFFGNNIVNSMSSGSMIQCIVFSVALGLVISSWRNSHDGNCIVYDFCSQLAELLIRIIRAVMTFAPVGIFCYVSSMIGNLGPEILIPLAKFLLTMAVGMVIMFIGYFIPRCCQM